jgi:general secretion pathway protein F
VSEHDKIPNSVTLEQLVALNEEMAALVRAGIPLEQGLVDLSRELPGRLGQLAGYLGTRMGAGESLVEIMARDPHVFPPVWRAVIEAGVRSGHLAVALEGLAKTGRNLAEMRKMIGLSLVYPLVVLTLAFLLFLFSVRILVPGTYAAYQDLTETTDPLLAWLSGLGATVATWAPCVPLVVMVLLGFWWYRSGRVLWSRQASSSRRGLLSRWLGWPSLAQAKRDGRMASFAEVLSLLVKQQVPIPEAVVLAGDASGDTQLSRASRQFAGQLQQGAMAGGQVQPPAIFPPLMGWLLASGQRNPALGETLEQSADSYRQRAERSLAWTTVYLPIFATVAIGGTATLIQALVVFAPVFRLLYGLSRPV